MTQNVSLSDRGGAYVICDPGFAHDADTEGYQKSVYPFFLILCALCDVGGDDVSRYFERNGEPDLRLGRFCGGASDRLYRWEPVPGGDRGVYCGVCGGAVDIKEFIGAGRCQHKADHGN